MLLVVDADERLLYASPVGVDLYGAELPCGAPVADVLGPQWLTTGDPAEPLEQLAVTGRWVGSALHRTDRGPVPVSIEARLRYVPGAASTALHLAVSSVEDLADWQRSLEALATEQRRERAQWRMGMDRLERLQAISTRLISVASLSDVADVVCGEALAGVGGHAAALFFVDEGRRNLRVFGTCGYPRELVQRWLLPPMDGSSPAGEAASTGRPVWVESVEDRDARFPALREAPGSSGSLCALPLLTDGPVFGVLGFSFPHPQQFDRSDRNFLLTVGQQCAQAITRIRAVGAQRPAPAPGRARMTVETASRRGTAAAVRRLLDHLVEAGAAVDRAGEVQLVLGELVANAMRHTDGPFRVAIDVDPDRVRVEVDDLSTTTPVRRHPDAHTMGGRGVLLVEGMTDRWGVAELPWGKKVWAELDNRRR